MFSTNDQCLSYWRDNNIVRESGEVYWPRLWLSVRRLNTWAFHLLKYTWSIIRNFVLHKG